MAGWTPDKVKRIITGDYALDADLEHGTQAETFFANQSKLPHLPVPELKETLELYLRTVQPLTTAEEYAHTKSVVDAFLAPGGKGETLYKRLLEHADQWKHSSWLQKWWNQMGYLQWRACNVINLNYYFQFAEDTGLPASTLSKNAAELNLQSLAAARMLTGVLAFRDRLIAGTEAPEMAGKAGQCCAQWKYLFNNCRVPAPDQDEFHLYNPTLPESNTVVVIRHNKYYTFPINHADGSRLSTADIVCQLQRIIKASGEDWDLAVGVLTSDDRDVWLKARNQLIADGNGKALEAIQQAAIAICLDDSTPVAREDIARKLWHGEQGANVNRWFDKTLSLISFKNGKMGCNVEHCMFDGSPTRHLMTTVLEGLRAGKIEHGSPSASPNLPEPAQIKFQITAATARMISESAARLDAWTGKHDMRVLAFQGFGSDAIKKMKCSPDAFAQMAIQLAYYKRFGKQEATYESSATRSFLHGRTETTRSVSNESAAWIAAMMNPKSDEKERHDLLMKAVAAHSDYLKKAGAGKGVDRLIWGLKLCLKAGESDPFFEDPIFNRTRTWVISTSHLAHELIDGWGFGEVCDHGIGVGYTVKAAMMQFTVTNQHKEEKWSLDMCELLDQTLIEMKSLCASAEKGFA